MQPIIKGNRLQNKLSPTPLPRTWALAACAFTSILTLLAIPAYAESATSETEKGTELILETLLEEGQPAATTTTSAISAAQAADSLRISESEEVIDLSTLSPEERAQLADSVGVWVNEVETPTPPDQPVEMVEPVQIKESAEQVVDASELTPDQLAEFPALKTEPLPVIQEQPAVAQPEPAAKTAPAPAVAEKSEKTAPRQVTMPRVTRWGGRPSPN